MKKIILTALSSLILFFSAQARSEELKVYIEPSVITQTDLGNKGYSVGDVVTRHGKVFLKRAAQLLESILLRLKLPTFIVTKKKMPDFL